MTDSSLSLGTAVIDDNGRVTLNQIGGNSIDFESITEALVLAKRQPAVTLENNIEDNETIISDYSSLKRLGVNLSSSLESLRGSTSSFTSDVFDQRSGTVQTYASDDAVVGHKASPSTDLVGISVEEGATTGVHTVEIIQKAAAHQIRSDVVESKYNDVSTLTPPIPAGSFSINGAQITITDNDSLADIADKINNANDETGVTATIISASDTEHYLVLSSDNTGTDNIITLSDVGGNTAEAKAILDTLGLTEVANSDFSPKNQVIEAKNAIIDIDGLGINIERQSNTITDVLDGISLDIYKAEPNTIIELDIDTDLSAVKQGVMDFVDAYNSAREFINEQQTSKPRELDEDGNVDSNADDEFGPLAFDSIFRQYSQEFTQFSAYTNMSNPQGYQSLSQLGISVDSEGMLTIDDETLDARLTENVKAIEDFFSFNMKSSDSNVTYISNSSKTVANTDVTGNTIPYYLSIEGTDADGNIIGASIKTGPGENDYLDGSVTISGNILTFTDATGAEGLKIIYNGGANMGEVLDIEITPTRGLADSFFFAQKDYIDTSSGQFDQKITTLAEQNEDFEDKITKIDERVERYESSIRAQFVATEQAMALADTLLKQLKMQFENNDD